MEIILGRQGNQPFPLTESSISRRHAILTYDKTTGQIRLRDNDSANGTWILGKDRIFRRLSGETSVSPDTVVRLGASVSFKVKDAIQEPPVDISHLRVVYDNYTNNKLALEAQSSNIMMIRMGSMTIGAAVGGLLITLLPEDMISDKVINGVVKALIPIACLVLGWLLSSIKNKDLIRKKSQNEQYLKSSYCCPKCGYHFGSQKVFANLQAEGRCPNNNCKVKFVVNQ